MMQTRLSDLRLTGATVLRDGLLQNRTVAIAGGRIAGGPFPVVDLAGYYVLPGLVDLYAPLPEAGSAETRIEAADFAAVAGGVTTGWVSQIWSWEGSNRGPDFAEAMLTAHAAHHARTDLRAQMTYETHSVDTSERFLNAARRFGVDYVVFSNSLDKAIAMWTKEPQAVEVWASRSGRTGTAFMDLVQTARSRSRDVPRSLCRLAEAFDEAGVIYGSLGEVDGEAREFFSALGARICVCPESHPAASVSKALGEPVLMPAGDLLRGRSGAVDAMSLIRAGKCSALVSNGDYPSLVPAAFSLVDQGVMDLPLAWAMVSATPARIMRLTDRGEIAQGKRADLVIVDKATRMVEGTIVGGRIAYLTGNVADRFLGDDRPLGMAAE